MRQAHEAGHMRQCTLGLFGRVSVGFTVLAGFGFCPFSPQALHPGEPATVPITRYGIAAHPELSGHGLMGKTPS